MPGEALIDNYMFRVNLISQATQARSTSSATATESESVTATMITMAGILLPLVAFLVVLSWLTPRKLETKGYWLPPLTNMAKREYEKFALKYSVFWIAAFGIVVVGQLYETFTENGYMALCVSLAAPLLLQPFFMPSPSERTLPYRLRYSLKATLWIAIFSFIGNYWYTHYFYSVLQAKYTFPCHRLNNVPISLFFATHFYFITYHTFSNLILRKIESTFVPSTRRTVLFWSTVCVFAYFTAFMETLTISSFPYYSFPAQVKQQMYTHGSAFYGLYFLASFPLFYRIDEKIDPRARVFPHSLWQTGMEALACGMVVLLLLDFGRLALNIPLTIPGTAFELTKH